MIPPVEPGLFSVDPPALLGGRCDACGALRFPHRNICPECQGDSVAIVPLSTSGTIYTFTIVRSKPPGYLGDVPYAFGLVDLPAGLRVIATIVADDIETIAVGDNVEFALMPLRGDASAVMSYCYRRRSSP